LGKQYKDNKQMIVAKINCETNEFDITGFEVTYSPTIAIFPRNNKAGV
jgi:hypothetical protein